MPPRRKTLEEFYWARVVKSTDGGCWGWTGCTQTAGYGSITLYGGAKVILSHRASWQIHFGPIPDGMFVCHKCDNPPCTNPDHLFIGTHSDNMKDAFKKGRLKQCNNRAWMKERTHCKHGHEFTEKNTYMWRGVVRMCKTCHANVARERYRRLKAEQAPVYRYEVVT